MDYYLFVELINLIILFFLPVCSIFICSCNTRTRQLAHLERRQALRDRQRQAVLSGKSVRSVIETEVESEETHCPTWICVGKLAPRLKSQKDVYEKLDQIDNASQKIDHEKPPFELVVHSSKKQIKTLKKEDGSSVKYTDIGHSDFETSTTSSESLVRSEVCK